MANENSNNRPTTKVIIERDSGNALGIASFVFGLLSIFIMAPVFVPLAVIVGGVAVLNKQFAWGIIGLVCALIGFLTSPILLGLFGLITLGAAITDETYKDKPQLGNELKTLEHQWWQTAGSAKERSLDNVSSSPGDDYQRAFKAGPVTVSAYGNCSPILNECGAYVVLRYDKQTLKIDSTGSYFHPILENEVSWVDNHYVTIDYANGGNCWTCEGIDIAALEDGKLFYVGKFNGFEDEYLVKAYDGLEHNELVSHALSPAWKLYFRYSRGKATLDFKKTCLTAKANYESDKNNLLHTFATKQKVDMSVDKDRWWLEENVKAPLLGTLALSRYCGWQSDYEKIIMTARSSHLLVTYELLQTLSKELALVQPAVAKE